MIYEIYATTPMKENDIILQHILAEKQIQLVQQIIENAKLGDKIDF